MKLAVNFAARTGLSRVIHCTEGESRSGGRGDWFSAGCKKGGGLARERNKTGKTAPSYRRTDHKGTERTWGKNEWGKEGGKISQTLTREGKERLTLGGSPVPYKEEAKSARGL